MARTRTPLVLLATLTFGVFLGVAFDRGGPFVAAQATRPPLPGPAASAGAASPGTTAQVRSEEADYQRLARQYEQFQHINRTFELVAKTVSPAVVHIVARKIGPERGRATASASTRRPARGSSSGGTAGQGLYVLTNHHVVLGASPAQINIYLQDGRVLHPDRVWSDAKADIAVLNLGRDDLPAARLGDSDEATVGTWVLALGSPFGLTHSVSQGIISARGRHMDELQDVEYQDFLQTDAAINPGNSGGPLVNMKGEVIGINNSIASNGGGNEGVGFSIPINLARWIMGQLDRPRAGQPGGPGRHPPSRVPDRGRPGAGARPPSRRLGRRRQSSLSRRGGGRARGRRGRAVQRGRRQRPEPPDQHGLHGADREAGRDGRLARPEEGEHEGHGRRQGAARPGLAAGQPADLGPACCVGPTARVSRPPSRWGWNWPRSTRRARSGWGSRGRCAGPP